MLGKECFILIKIKKRSADDYIEHENDGDTLSKTILATDYLDETGQHLTKVIKKLKSAGFSRKMNFVLGCIIKEMLFGVFME